MFNTTGVFGEVLPLKALTRLTALALTRSHVSGDVGTLKSLARLTRLDLSSTGVSGDVGQLSRLRQLADLRLSGTDVTGLPLLLANGKTVGGEPDDEPHRPRRAARVAVASGPEVGRLADTWADSAPEARRVE